MTIEWCSAISYPIAVDHERLNGACQLVTVAAITFRRFAHAETVPAQFRFDGATVPRLFWFVPGFAPIGKHLWAALLHDWLCAKAQRGEFDRAIADAVFATLLVHTDVGFWRGLVMDVAVNGYRRWSRLQQWLGRRG